MSNQVIGCAIEVPRALGPGLLESAYEQWLVYELSLAGIPFQLRLKHDPFKRTFEEASKRGNWS